MIKNTFTFFGWLLGCASLLAQTQVGSFSITPKIGASVSTLKGEPTLVLCSYNVDRMQNFTHYDAPDTYEADLYCKPQSTTNIYFGLEAERQYSQHWGIAVGCYYAKQGADYKPEEALDFNCQEYRTSLQYLQFPILGKFYLFKGFALQAGLQPGVLLKDETRFRCTFRGASFDETLGLQEAPFVFEGKESLYETGAWGFSGIDKRDFDLSLLLGFSYEIKNIVVDARYNISTVPLYEEEVFSSNLSRCKLRSSSFVFTIGYRFELSK